MFRMEALALSIAHEHQAFETGSEAFQTLNPGLLKSHLLDRFGACTPDGTRVFTSFQGGYRALLSNLQVKCSGQPKASGEPGRLSRNSSLEDLCKTFRYLSVRNIVEFLQDALNDSAISNRTPISFFLEE